MHSAVSSKECSPEIYQIPQMARLRTTIKFDSPGTEVVVAECDTNCKPFLPTVSLSSGPLVHYLTLPVGSDAKMRLVKRRSTYEHAIAILSLARNTNQYGPFVISGTTFQWKKGALECIQTAEERTRRDVEEREEYFEHLYRLRHKSASPGHFQAALCLVILRKSLPWKLPVMLDSEVDTNPLVSFSKEDETLGNRFKDEVAQLQRYNAGMAYRLQTLFESNYQIAHSILHAGVVLPVTTPDDASDPPLPLGPPRWVLLSTDSCAPGPVVYQVAELARHHNPAIRTLIRKRKRLLSTLHSHKLQRHYLCNARRYLLRMDALVKSGLVVLSSESGNVSHL